MAPIIPLATAQANLNAWLAASTSIAASQSYTIETDGMRRQLTRADAAEVRQQITFWSNLVARAQRFQNRRTSTRYIVPE